MGSLFAGIAAFFAASFLGIWLKKRSIAKWKFYHSYYDYLLFVTEKIASVRMPRSEIDAAFRSESKDFSELLSGKEPSIALKNEEKERVMGYIRSIGGSDAEVQLASLRTETFEIKRILDSDGEKWRKDASLYFKLCVLLGIALFIILA